MMEQTIVDVGMVIVLENKPQNLYRNMLIVISIKYCKTISCPANSYVLALIPIIVHLRCNYRKCTTRS